MPNEDLTPEQFRAADAKAFKSHRRRHTPGEMNKTEQRMAAELAIEPRAGTIRFIVVGRPLGKPRMTQRDKWAKRECVLAYRSWADAIRSAAGKLPPASHVTRLDWIAVFVPPRSWSATRRAMMIGRQHRSRPDRDNIDKAVLDALFACDSAIAFGTISKVWGEQDRIEIAIAYDLEAAP